MYTDWALVAVFGAVLAWGIGDFLIQRSVRRIGDLECLAIIGIIGTLGLLPWVWNDIPSLFLPENGQLLLGLGIVTFVAAILNFEAYRVGKLSVVEVVLEFELPVTILLGIFFFSEMISPVQAILMGIIFIGILCIAIEPRMFSSKKVNWVEKGVVLALFGALGMGLMDFLTGAASKQVSPLMAIWAPYVVFTIVCLATIAWNGKFKAFIKGMQKHRDLVLATGVADTAAWVLFAIALQHNPISITTAITEIYPAIGLFLGLKINHERIAGHQWLGAGLAIIGSVALAFFF